MKSDNLFTKRFNYSEEWFRVLYVFVGVFCIICGLIALISRTQFSHTVFGKYFLEFLVLSIFVGGLAAIIYSNWRFRK
jgi:hypothetical protein